MSIFKELTSIEALPLWGEIAFVIIIILCIIFSIETDKTMTCKSQDSYCTVTSYNLLRIKKSKRLISPKNISLIKIDSYQKETHSRHTSSRRTKYLISLVDKDGNTITVFDDYKTPEQASEIRKQVQSCIKQGAYPCIVKER